MKNQDVYNIAVNFRKAIIEAKANREFSFQDRMIKFPNGCCDDSCDLLAYYLYETYYIHTKQVNGVYRDKNPYTRMKKADIKRFLAIYFEASMNGDLMPDYDGEQYISEVENEKEN